jgi:hypothetical protein
MSAHPVPPGEVIVAVVRIGLVRKQIEALCESSQRVKHLVKVALAAVDKDPDQFSTLDRDKFPQRIAELLAGLEGVVVRKVEIVHQRHNYRLLFLHRKSDEEEERAIFFQVLSRRRNGYDAIDWDMLESMLRGEED